MPLVLPIRIVSGLPWGCCGTAGGGAFLLSTPNPPRLHPGHGAALGPAWAGGGGAREAREMPCRCPSPSHGPESPQHPTAPPPFPAWGLGLGFFRVFPPRRPLLPRAVAGGCRRRRAGLGRGISLPFGRDPPTSEQAPCQFCDPLPASKWRQEGIHFHQGDDSASVFLTIWREAPPARKQSAEEQSESVEAEGINRTVNNKLPYHPVLVFGFFFAGGEGFFRVLFWF